MDDTTTIQKNVEMTRGSIRGKKSPAITPYRVQGETELLSPPGCEGKVLRIRQQLAEDKYDFNRRLNAAFDKLLDELFGREDTAIRMAVC